MNKKYSDNEFSCILILRILHTKIGEKLVIKTILYKFWELSDVAGQPALSPKGEATLSSD